jgi:hypothetical protein
MERRSLPYHNIDIFLNVMAPLSLLYGGCMQGEAMRAYVVPSFIVVSKEEKEFNAMAGLSGGMENALQDLLDAHEQQRPPASSLHTARKTTALIQEVREWQKRRS